MIGLSNKYRGLTTIFIMFYFDNNKTSRSKLFEAANGLAKTIISLIALLLIVERIDKELFYCTGTYTQLDSVLEELNYNTEENIICLTRPKAVSRLERKDNSLFLI